MKINRKKILITLAVILFIGASGVIYLNKVFLPQKIKNLLVDGLQQATGTKVELGSLEFNIFKGLVMKDLRFYDGPEKIVTVRECSLTFLVLPVFKKTLIIPNVHLSYPHVLLERNPDNTFNLQRLVPGSKPADKRTVPASQKTGQAGLPVRQAGWRVLVYRVSVSGGSIDFKDNGFTPAFSVSIQNLNLVCRLSLPSSIKCSLKAEISYVTRPRITATITYGITDQKVSARIMLKDFAPEIFSVYLKGTGVDLGPGLLDSRLQLEYAKDTVSLSGEAKIKNLSLKQGDLRFDLKGRLGAGLKYNLRSKTLLEYSGGGNIERLDITGPAPAGEIKDLNAEFKLDNSGISSDRITAKFLGEPLTASLILTDFKNPRIRTGFSWGKLKADADLSLKDKIIGLNSVKATYMNSSCSVSGQLDTASPSLLADLSGEANLELSDLDSMLEAYREQLQEVKAEGIINAAFSLAGDLKDIKKADINARLSSSQFSLYGMRFNNLTLDYNQVQGQAEIPSCSVHFYDGLIQSAARMNIASENLPCSVDFDLEGVRIEKLKQDTGLKDQDISGDLSCRMRINGFLSEPDKISGSGRIVVKEARLWRLSLFKGLGKLIFAKDFNDIVFHDAYCDFLIKDKGFLTDNLTVKGNLLDINASGRLGFDTSLDFSVNTSVNTEAIAESDMVKDVASLLLGEAGNYIAIKVSGTLKQPKYSIKPSVTGMIEGIRALLPENIFGK